MAEDASRDSHRSNTTFEFVNYQQPGDVKAAKTRRQVRSHVSRWQHQLSRERIGNASNSETGSASAREPSPIEITRKHKRAAVMKTADIREAYNETENVNSTVEMRSTFQSPRWRALGGSALSESFSRGTMSFRTLALHDSRNVVGNSLEELGLELSSVMALYKSMSERQSLDFIRQYGQGSGFRFVPLIFTDPILLSTAVLIGVRNQLDVQGRRLEGKVSTGVLGIEQFVTSGINNALSDPIRSVSDQMLLVVGLCAAYEIKHGNSAHYHMHMRGLVQMIKLRGGLLAVGDPDPYVLRVLFWLDVNTAKLAHCEPYFESLDDGVEIRLLADPAMFRHKGLISNEDKPHSCDESYDR